VGAGSRGLSSRTFFVRTLLRWGRRNRRDFPWRSDTDPFRVLVAEILLQRSRAGTVAKVYEALFARWPTPETLAGADPDEIRTVIRPLGLVSRAVRLRDLAAVVAEGGVPRSPEDLQRLPGVGAYAARATAAVAFGRRTAVVDGVSARVYRRYFGAEAVLAPTADPALWRLVEEVTPNAAVREWNWAVLDHASAICTPKVPRCGLCPLEPRCAYAVSGGRRAE